MSGGPPSNDPASVAGDGDPTALMPAAASSSAPGAVQPLQGPAGAALQRRTQAQALAAATANAAAIAAAARSSKAASTARSGPVVPWEQLPLAQQIVALTNDEMIHVVLGSLWPGERYVAEIEAWSKEEVIAVARRFNVALTNDKGNRSSVRRVIEGWAVENPLLCAVDPPGFVRTRKQAANRVAAAHAQIAAEAAASSGNEEPSSPEAGDTGASESDGEYVAMTPKRGKSSKQANQSGRSGRGPRLSAEVTEALRGLRPVSGGQPPSRGTARDATHRSFATFPAAASNHPTQPSRSNQHRSSHSGQRRVELVRPRTPSPHDTDEEEFYDELYEPQEPERTQQAASSSSRTPSVDDPLAAEWIKSVLRSAVSVEAKWATLAAQLQHERNRREIMSWVRLIDAVYCDKKADALEIAVRRVVGVQLADKTGDWGMCNVLENYSEERAYLPVRLYNSVAKQAATQSALLANLKKQQSETGAGAGHGKPKGGWSGQHSKAAGAGGAQDAKPASSTPK